MGGIVIDVDCRTEHRRPVRRRRRRRRRPRREPPRRQRRRRLDRLRRPRRRHRGRARAASAALREPRPRAGARVGRSARVAPLRRQATELPFLLTRELKDAMWEGCGVVRDRAGLERRRASGSTDLGERLGRRRRARRDRRPTRPGRRRSTSRNQLTVARVIVASRARARGVARRPLPRRHPRAGRRPLAARAVARGGATTRELGWQPGRRSTRAAPRAVAEAAP